MKMIQGELLGKLKKVKGLTLIVIGLVAGLLCFILPEFTGVTKTETTIETDETLSDFTEAEEAKAAAILNAIDGVRSARVMLTLESGEKRVYGSGGYSGNAPLLEEYPPRISGVAVVCAGGNDPEVQMKIISLMCSLYGISSARVSVCGAS